MPRRHPSLEGRELDQARRRPLGTPPRHGGGASAGHAPADPPLTPLPGGHAHGRAPRPGTEAEATQTRDSSLLPGLRLRVSAGVDVQIPRASSRHFKSEFLGAGPVNLHAPSSQELVSFADI
ncbi:uncharacterized protein LOC119509331 isoform X2 [Choloepus didactylus]|uniref:uncharacterized protein LOC119509331 isoform X2 n=1 Tax=Choloepus didactylus TaxID=27675 RepID=UPI00189EEA29|nr:uncharacterized protein LOC119509331 isoform X2 [Choloepus didactylus]